MFKEYLRKKLNNFLSHSSVLDNNERVLLSHVDYLLHKKRNSRVVYTCLTGDYDNLPVYRYFDPEWDYVCFTDNEKLLKYTNFGIWQIRPLVFQELDNTRNNRWHKTHPHVLFPEYRDSIYIDSNICIKTAYIFTLLDSYRESDILVPLHNLRDCTYEEANIIMEKGKDTKENIDKMVNILKKDNFPCKYGMNENCVIYRKHLNSFVVKIMNEWWEYIKNICKRDQLSFSYVLWKNNLRPSDIGIPNIRIREEDFYFSVHKK